MRVGVIIYDLEAMCGCGTRKLGFCLFVSRYGFFFDLGHTFKNQEHPVS